jgi:hypothetical protein
MFVWQETYYPDLIPEGVSPRCVWSTSVADSTTDTSPQMSLLSFGNLSIYLLFPRRFVEHCCVEGLHFMMRMMMKN